MTTLGEIEPDLVEQDVTLRALFENTTAGIAEIDAATGRFLRVNRRYCEITGRSEAELLGECRIHDVLHPDEERVAISVAEARGDAERRYLRPDGQVTWVRISVAVTARDACGKALRISAIVQDVTDRHTAQEKLRASEALLRLSLDVGQVGCFSRDLVTGDIQCGTETRAMHGLPPGEIPITSEIWLATVVPEDRDDLLAAVRMAMADRKPEVNYEYRFHHPVTGALRHIEVRTRYEYDSQGQPASSVGAIVDVTARREAEARITHLAYHDPLTGFPNRSLFRQRLETALEQAKGGRDVAVLYLDLDDFKDVNDMHGHSVGDGLLCDVAARLQFAMDKSTSIARLGGDEFAIIQRGRDLPAEAAALAERLIEALRLTFVVEGHYIEIGTSIGISLAPQDGVNADEILKAADLALYDAKAEGGGCYRLYQPAMSARLQLRRDLELDLRRAVAQGEFEMFYQPILHLGTLRPVAMEALLRWAHPLRGMVQPDSFIPLAEKLGLIVPLGEWALARSCADAAAWPSTVRVAVNLSAVQFGSRDLVTTVASILENTGLDPNRLELEITESVMLEDTQANLAMLHRLKDLGVRIALDDFGTGYSSLSYLRSFPFDKVKIDRSFTRDLGQPQSNAIMRTMLDLCAGLGLTSTVEGVETQDQLRVLKKKGCMQVQGYLFSRPVPACQVDRLLAELTAGAYPAENVA
ncbi:MAG: putative bifunctional diguanylate cyclase/phosphodiesterase [Janthinobacterium lividum]